MRAFIARSLGVFLVILVLSGCGSGAGSTTNLTPYAPSAITPSDTNAIAVVGALQGSVGDRFLQLAKTTPYSGRTDQPVLVGSGPLPSTLVDVYNAGQVVVLVYPDLARINELRALLGMSPYAFPAGVTRLDYYGLSNAGGADAELVSYLPDPDPTASGEEGNADESHPLAPEVIHSYETTDSTDQDVQEALEFIASHRDTVALKNKLAAAAPTPTPNVVTPGLDFQLAAVRRVEKDYTFEFQKAKMNVTTTVWAVHHVETGDDYFFIRQSGTFAPGAAMERNRDDDRGWYANSYQLSTIVDGYTDNTAVTLATSATEPQPSTAEGVTEVSSSFGFNLGGKFTFADAADKGASRGLELNGQLSLSDTRKIVIRDMKLQSTCGSQVNDASWRYVLHVPDGITWTCKFPNFGAVPHLPDLAYNTFTPVNFWAWKVTPSVREKLKNGMPIKIAASMRLSRLRLPLPCLASHQSVESGQMTQTFTVPWPPRSRSR